MAYRRDPVDTEYVQDAQRTLLMGSGDCDDKCVLLATLLASLGHTSRFVAQSSDGATFDHVYVEVLLNNEWIALDPTADGRGGVPLAAVGWRNPTQSEWAFEIFD